MSAKLKVGIVGGTGMVGQRFVDLLDQHPWFEVTAISASANSAGKTYEESVQGRWKLAVPIPEAVKKSLFRMLPRLRLLPARLILFSARLI